MAQTARKVDETEKCRTMARVVPMTSVPELPPSDAQEKRLRMNKWESQPSAVEDARRRASRVVSLSKDRSSTVYRESKTRVGNTYTTLAQYSGELTRRIQGRAQQIKDEHPLRLLAAIAGTAFVAGIVIRIWRSSRYE